jgi:hypothetical protein
MAKSRVSHAAPVRFIPKGFQEVEKPRPAVKNFGGEKMTVHGFDPDPVPDFKDIERIQEQGVSVDNDDVRREENRSRHGSHSK